MQPFQPLTGVVATMDRANVDTDQIIPKQFLKRIERSGFGQFLFYDWRSNPDGTPNPAFELNLPRNQGAKILVARRNFGSGSSREHAVWALQDYGFQVVISSRFADIFRGNSGKAGLVTALVDQDVVEQLWQMVDDDPSTPITVDLEGEQIRAGEVVASFDIDPYVRWRLLQGLDDIGITLQNEGAISEFESRRPSFSPTTL